MSQNFEKFIISQKAVLIRDSKCLICEDAARPAGCWDLPGGRVEVGESGEESFRKEIKEELGFDDFKILGLVDYEIWYTSDDKKPHCGIANLINNDKDDIVLSDEHSSYKWISEKEIDNYEFVWSKDRGASGLENRILKNGFKLYKELKKNGKL